MELNFAMDLVVAISCAGYLVFIFAINRHAKKQRTQPPPWARQQGAS